MKKGAMALIAVLFLINTVSITAQSLDIGLAATLFVSDGENTTSLGYGAGLKLEANWPSGLYASARVASNSLLGATQSLELAGGFLTTLLPGWQAGLGVFSGIAHTDRTYSFSSTTNLSHLPPPLGVPVGLEVTPARLSLGDVRIDLFRSRLGFDVVQPDFPLWIETAPVTVSVLLNKEGEYQVRPSSTDSDTSKKVRVIFGAGYAVFYLSSWLYYYEQPIFKVGVGWRELEALVSFGYDDFAANLQFFGRLAPHKGFWRPGVGLGVIVFTNPELDYVQSMALAHFELLRFAFPLGRMIDGVISILGFKAGPIVPPITYRTKNFDTIWREDHSFFLGIDFLSIEVHL